MTKLELISELYTRHAAYQPEDKRRVKAIVESVFEIIVREVSKKRPVQIAGFGTFKATTRAEHGCLNPRTGEPITIPEHILPTFTAGKQFKEQANEEGRTKPSTRPFEKTTRT